MEKTRKAVLLMFGLSGMAALIYEVVWTRFLTLIFGSTTYAISTMLASFMAGLALGSILIGKRMHKITNHYKTFAYLEFGIGAYGLIFIFLLNLLQGPFLLIYKTFETSFFLFTIAQFLLIFMVMIVPTTMMGATFPLISKIFVRDMEKLGKDISYVYSFNSLGAVIGPILAGFILIPLIGITKTNIFATVINILIALFMLNKDKIKIYTALLLIPLILIPYINPMPLYTNINLLRVTTNQEQLNDILKNSEVLFYKEGAYSTVAVIEHKNVTTLFIDGRASASTGSDMITQLMLGYLPLLLHQKASSALNIGLGSGISLGAIESFDNLKEIDTIEIEPAVVEAAEYFSKYNHYALRDKRQNLILNDARQYLLLTDKKYDVVVSEPSHPLVSGSSQLFTKEFFELTKSKLNEHGIFSQWVPLYSMSPEDFTIILNTFSSVFPHTEVWLFHPGDAILLGSVNPEKIGVTELMLQFQNPRISSDMNNIGINSQNFPNFLILDENKVKELTKNVSKMNTDDNALIEFRTPKRTISGQDETTRFILEKGGKIFNSQ
jgi:spermidine synthase